LIDVDIKHEDGFFKLRVCGVVKKNNKILTLKASSFDGYCFPGGHLELGELSRVGVLREMKEELGIEVEIEHLICVNENVFTNVKGTTSHEIAYYYLVAPKSEISEEDFVLEEMDKGKLKRHNFCWLELDKIDNYNLMPPMMGDFLKNNKKDIVVSLDQR
jgi:ADP-ribose pyrophosphatase YjhB (NUDIX family)